MYTIGPLEKLGTVWWLELFDCDEKKGESIEKEMVEHIDNFERSYSRFRKDSLLSKLNDNKLLSQSPSEMRAMLSLALEAYKLTDGVFNIAIGAYLEAQGYDADYSFTKKKLAVGIPALDEVIKIEGETITLEQNARLDFGGFGKGYLIDSLGHLLKNKLGIEHFLINGGGDMLATSDEEGRPITIGVQDPHHSDKLLGSLALHHEAFAASSSYMRSWHDQDGDYHHHLVGSDNKDGASFIVASTAVWADIWATSLAIAPQKLTLPSDIQALSL